MERLRFRNLKVVKIENMSRQGISIFAVSDAFVANFCVNIAYFCLDQKYDLFNCIREKMLNEKKIEWLLADG